MVHVPEAHPMIQRRTVLGFAAGCALGTALAGCAHAPQDDEAITELATGARLTRADLLARLRASDYVLLGERHDHPTHHRLRAELLAALPAPAVVVAEHLPQGAAVALPQDATGDALRRALEAGGFDANSWQWPLHEPLFAAVARHQHTLRGGNLPRDLARRTAREGAAALPAELRALIDAAPLAAGSREALLDELLHSHCGQLPRERMPNMLLAQRGRDAAMAASLREARGRTRPASGPVLLLAGNGHVRRDHGVAQLLARLDPSARVLVVGFVESGERVLPELYDLAWTTAPNERPAALSTCTDAA